MPAQRESTPSERATRLIEKARRSGTIHLDLSGLGLTAIPDSLGQLPHLRGIYLSDNQFTVIPDSLLQLEHLQSLYLSRNRITTIPDSLARLCLRTFRARLRD